MLFGSKIYIKLKKHFAISVSILIHLILLLSYIIYNVNFNNKIYLNYANSAISINVVNNAYVKQNHPAISTKEILKQSNKPQDVINSKDNKNNPQNNKQNLYTHKQVSYQDLISKEGNSIPPYPLIAKVNKWEGEVVLIVIVNTNGVVESIQIKQSSGHKVLDDTAISAIKAWSIPNNSGQSITIEIPVMFKLISK